MPKRIMRKDPYKPFHNLSKEAWQNLVIVAFLGFYAGQVILDISWNNYCGNLAIDYCAYWSAGKIANIDGYEQVYNLNRLWDVQKPISSKYMLPEQYDPVPVPYLPVFIVPFQLFALFDVIPSFWTWTVLNIIGIITYLIFFTRKISLRKPFKKRILILAFISLPVFLDLFQGQFNLLLMVCVGEFLRKIMDDKQFLAGIWLGGLLLKPQILILIIPFLFLKRRWRALYGFAISSFGLGLISFLIGGLTSIQKMVQLWIGYTGGLPSNYPEAMMNWRMVALNVNAIFNSNIGWWIAIPCLIATLIYAFYGWRIRFDFQSPEFVLAILGTFAATSTIAWHSHFSMTMIMISILLDLISENILSKELFSFCFFYRQLLW